MIAINGNSIAEFVAPFMEPGQPVEDQRLLAETLEDLLPRIAKLIGAQWDSLCENDDCPKFNIGVDLDQTDKGRVSMKATLTWSVRNKTSEENERYIDQREFTLVEEGEPAPPPVSKPRRKQKVVG